MSTTINGFTLLNMLDEPLFMMFKDVNEQFDKMYKLTDKDLENYHIEIMDFLLAQYENYSVIDYENGVNNLVKNILNKITPNLVIIYKHTIKQNMMRFDRIKNNIDMIENTNSNYAPLVMDDIQNANKVQSSSSYQDLYGNSNIGNIFSSSMWTAVLKKLNQFFKLYL